jgi:hypothetical protein
MQSSPGVRKRQLKLLRKAEVFRGSLRNYGKGRTFTRHLPGSEVPRRKEPANPRNPAGFSKFLPDGNEKSGKILLLLDKLARILL